MDTITAGPRARGERAEARSLRRDLARLDQDQASLDRARQLLEQGRRLAAAEPAEAFELVHRAALRGAGVLVTRANRQRRRRLPLNVWRALERIGGGAAERAAEMAPLVAERYRLGRDSSGAPDPVLLELHLRQTADHLDRVAEELVADLPGSLTPLAG